MAARVESECEDIYHILEEVTRQRSDHNRGTPLQDCQKERKLRMIGARIPKISVQLLDFAALRLFKATGCLGHVVWVTFWRGQRPRFISSCPGIHTRFSACAISPRDARVPRQQQPRRGHRRSRYK